MDWGGEREKGRGAPPGRDYFVVGSVSCFEWGKGGLTTCACLRGEKKRSGACVLFLCLCTYLRRKENENKTSAPKTHKNTPNKAKSLKLPFSFLEMFCLLFFKTRGFSSIFTKSRAHTDRTPSHPAHPHAHISIFGFIKVLSNIKILLCVLPHFPHFPHFHSSSPPRSPHPQSLKTRNANQKLSPPRRRRPPPRSRPGRCAC